MRKRAIVFVFLSLILILSFAAFVSAGVFSDLFHKKKITAEVIQSDLDYCSDTCSSLGYVCGNRIICGQVIYCGTCSSGYTCSEGKCLSSSLAYSCQSLFNKSKYWFSLCAQAGYPAVCLNKFSGEYQGCEKSLSGLTCTSNNLNAAQNIVCSVLTVPTCIDTDGGTDYYNTGIITYTYNITSTTKNITTRVMDYCNNNNAMEAYCFFDENANANFGWRNTFCVKGCSNGSCVKNVYSQEFCKTKESDNGINYTKKGEVNITSVHSVTLKQIESVYILGRFIFINSLNSTGVVLNISGIPTLTPRLSKNMNYSLGKDILTLNNIVYNLSNVKGNYIEFTLRINTPTERSDYCINSSLLKEFYCDGTASVLKETNHNCGAENKMCISGACLVAPTCVDSDGGDFYNSKGTITYTYGGLSNIPNNKTTVSDSCSGTWLTEWYCYTDDFGIPKYKSKGMYCTYGCLNGACRIINGIVWA